MEAIPLPTNGPFLPGKCSQVGHVSTELKPLATNAFLKIKHEMLREPLTRKNRLRHRPATGERSRLPTATSVRTLSALAVAAALALASLLPGLAATTPAGAARIPAGLPNRFGIGLAAQPDASGLTGWLPESGIPFDYVYQYLAAGVNTGNGWATWNPNGTFVTGYARSAAERGAIPVFPYYMLFQSNSPCPSTCSEARRDLANLNDRALMAAYYADFALAMKRLGPGTYDGVPGFGRTAIVQVEPDLSGYAQQAVLEPDTFCFGFCSGQGNTAANLRAVVGSSGQPDVAGFADTYQGFNQALLRLRDLYAPNVLLAFHVSNWATRQDIGSNTDPNLDAVGLGQQAGQFAATSGTQPLPGSASTYDLVFNDVADRDAGYYTYVYGRQNAFWDRLNVTVPNFRRWEQYLGAALEAAGGKPGMVWQIPLGNQYARSVNNTEGHYQDNRAEYFFENVDELARIGVIALLFGRGNDGSTTTSDARKDGITNPAVVCTSDGLSSGTICNDHPATVADDDGGYLRMAAARYYASGPLALGGALAAPRPVPTTAPAPSAPAPAPAPAAPAPAPARFTSTAEVSTSATVAGGTQTIAAAVASDAASVVLVDLEVYDPAGAKVGQTFWDDQRLPVGEARTYTWAWTVPEQAAPGRYTVKIGIFRPGWAALNDWNDAATTFTVGAANP